MLQNIEKMLKESKNFKKYINGKQVEKAESKNKILQLKKKMEKALNFEKSYLGTKTMKMLKSVDTYCFFLYLANLIVSKHIHIQV